MGNAIVGTVSLVAAPLIPILWLQGRHVRRHTPRLPEATGPTVGTVAGAGVPVRLLVVGESTVAGVGAPDHAHALTGQIAAALAVRMGRPVHWHAVGKSGVTARAARTRLVPEIPAAPVDIIVLALGVNDVLRLHGPGRWTRDVTQLIADLRGRVGAAPVVLASVPPLGRCPAFPQPLRSVLGLRAAALDRAVRRCVLTLPGVTHSPASRDMTGMLGTDRFHPSIQGYRRWGTEIAESALAGLKTGGYFGGPGVPAAPAGEPANRRFPS